MRARIHKAVAKASLLHRGDAGFADSEARRTVPLQKALPSADLPAHHLPQIIVRPTVKVVQESNQGIIRAKACCSAVQGIVLALSEQSGGQRASEFIGPTLLASRPRSWSSHQLYVEGRPLNMRTKGSRSGASSCSLAMNDALDMQSCALHPLATPALRPGVVTRWYGGANVRGECGRANLQRELVPV